tara:strand:+ start:23 stop:403 length:381 start_codon:yes stop_codon:yes gene_type:complete
MKSKNSNKGFGLLFFIVFLLIGLWPLTKHETPKIIFLFISLIFLTLGLLDSKLLTPLNKSWIKFGEILGTIIAPIIMAIIYFIILTPISLLVRLTGKDLLKVKFSNTIGSYWIKRDKDVGPMNKQY